MKEAMLHRRPVGITPGLGRDQAGGWRSVAQSMLRDGASLGKRGLPVMLGMTLAL